MAACFSPQRSEQPNGPEIDAGIDDRRCVLIYAEAKWQATLGTGKGAVEGEDDDQIMLRLDSLGKDPALGPDSDRVCMVLGISNEAPDLSSYDTTLANPDYLRTVLLRWLTWGELAACSAHPHAEEFARYLDWKGAHG